MMYRSPLLSISDIIGSRRLQRKGAIEKLIQERKRDPGRGVSAEGLKERAEKQPPSCKEPTDCTSPDTHIHQYDKVARDPLSNATPKGGYLAKCRLLPIEVELLLSAAA